MAIYAAKHARFDVPKEAVQKAIYENNTSVADITNMYSGQVLVIECENRPENIPIYDLEWIRLDDHSFIIVAGAKNSALTYAKRNELPHLRGYLSCADKARSVREATVYFTEDSHRHPEYIEIEKILVRNKEIGDLIFVGYRENAFTQWYGRIGYQLTSEGLQFAEDAFNAGLMLGQKVRVDFK